ncbi:putative nitrilase [Aspergillus taichungensis]|uniref:nitrilase n=1 Tax=Aspergillus taichungensis TaxID=482145 RepID=A0A2J5I828_9EURO|nr:putative nitrilase [Aspergillus taichungensis]
MPTVRVGAIQAEPVYLDLEGGVNKAVKLIQEASEKGVQVLGFPEVWVGGPLWSQCPLESAGFFSKYIAQSLPRDSPQMRRIQNACKEHSIFVVLGYSEKDNGSIYMAQAFINESGEIIHNRRKIKPTHVERSLWGEGQADSLKCVVDSQHGRIGALNCWENLQPLLRYYEYSQNVQIHVAAWPSFPAHPREVDSPMPYSNSGEANLRLSQMIAMEGQTFVLCATGVMKAETHELMGVKDRGIFHGDGGGFAMIFGPDGSPLAEPMPVGEEGILTADVDLDAIHAAKNLCDPVGHYSRPDLLSLRVNTVPAKVVHHE